MVSDYSTFTSIPWVNELSMGPLGFGASHAFLDIVLNVGTACGMNCNAMSPNSLMGRCVCKKIQDICIKVKTQTLFYVVRQLPTSMGLCPMKGFSLM